MTKTRVYRQTVAEQIASLKAGEGTYGCVPGKKCRCPNVYPLCIAIIAIRELEAGNEAYRR